MVQSKFCDHTKTALKRCIPYSRCIGGPVSFLRYEAGNKCSVVDTYEMDLSQTISFREPRDPVGKLLLCSGVLLGRGTRDTASPCSSLIVYELADDLWSGANWAQNVPLNEIEHFRLRGLYG